MKRRLINERIEFLQFDEGSNTVPQILIKSGLTLNNTFFAPSVLKEAIDMFEGCRCYVDHGSPWFGRSITEMSGWLTDVRYDEQAEALIGTRHFVENQSGRDMKAMIKSILAGDTPQDLYGASIKTWVEGDFEGTEDGVESEDAPIYVVKKIVQVDSVDDVDKPAAGGGWKKKLAASESVFAEIMQHADFDDWLESRPDYAKRLKNDYRKARQTDEIKALQARLQAHETTEGDLRANLQQSKDDLHAAQVDLLLARSGLPAGWTQSLRMQLLGTEPASWGSLLDGELAKFKSIEASQQGASGITRGQPATESQASDSVLDNALAHMY